MERIARKLRRIILLHFGLVTFRIHHWKTLHFHGFGSGGRDHDSRHQLFLILESPRYFKKSKKRKQINGIWKYDNFQSWKCWRCVLQQLWKLWIWRLATLKLRNQNQQNKKSQNFDTYLFSSKGIPCPSTYRLPPLHQSTLLGDTSELGGHETKLQFGRVSL